LNRLVDAALGECEHSGGVDELVELGAWELRALLVRPTAERMASHIEHKAMLP